MLSGSGRGAAVWRQSHQGPIREAIVSMGPFVMNTQAEIQQTIRGYQQEKQQGKFGELSL
ncbi:hypothetical protein JYB88_14740 [Shewanella cyperi]|uniref:Pirin C-terminal domain-containing protein n=1 Tax=Shewanella cyperi TaxID=2814292 RepID=A0A975AKQ4_9GAMM|nr:hypothetical protein JYB88_14740 [Shewanella cyperi]